MHKSEPLKIKTKTTDSKISAAAPVITVSITKKSHLSVRMWTETKKL